MGAFAIIADLISAGAAAVATFFAWKAVSVTAADLGAQERARYAGRRGDYYRALVTRPGLELLQDFERRVVPQMKATVREARRISDGGGTVKQVDSIVTSGVETLNTAYYALAAELRRSGRLWPDSGYAVNLQGRLEDLQNDLVEALDVSVRSRVTRDFGVVAGTHVRKIVSLMMQSDPELKYPID